MMNLNLFYIAFGGLTVLTVILLTATFLLGKKDYWLAVISLLLANAFSGSLLLSTGTIQLNNLVLLASVITAVFAIPFIWREMVIRPIDYPGQWTLLLSILSLVVLNQFLLKSSFLLLIPSALLAMALIVRFVVQNRKITEANIELSKELDQKRVAVGLDLATGLPNKLAFAERIEKWLFIHPEEKVNIVVFKFTRFNELNALIGHNNADLVKIQLTTRLKSKLASNQSVLNLSDSIDIAPFATVGGVDFATAIRADKHNYATENFIELLKTSIREPIVVDSTAVDVGIEFGVASYPAQGNSVESLIENAYIAMNLAQSTESSIYFDRTQQDDLVASRTIISQLKEDIKQQRFLIYVQPQVSLSSKEVIGGELLIRWSRTDHGVIAADEFIRLAEQSGLIYQLNLWTIESAIKTLAEFKEQGLPQTLSVNVSNRELFQSQLVESVINLLDKYMVEPSKLVIEIKESAFAINQHKALKVARLFQQAGVKIAIDDFGKDRTAIGTFNNFTPYYLKVDCRQLSKGKSGDQVNTYVNALVGMAKTLQLPVIAQGIETDQTEKQLKDLECDVGQGFLYSKPFELKGFAVWLEQWRRKKRG